MSASIGLRSRTGRVIAVALAGTVKAPVIFARRELSLLDPKPSEAFLYHAVMELPWPEAERAVQPSVRMLERTAVRLLGEMLGELKTKNIIVERAGIVGSPNRNVESIGNYHIRAHAAEGQVFRRVWEVAAEGSSLRFETHSDKSLFEDAAARLNLSIVEVNRVLSELGQSVGSPWRADEKLAATAAWLALKAGDGR
jgi:hypothetical protein